MTATKEVYVMSPVACPTVHILGEYVPRMHRLELTIVLMMVVVVVDIPLFFCFFYIFSLCYFVSFSPQKRKCILFLINTHMAHSATKSFTNPLCLNVLQYHILY